MELFLQKLRHRGRVINYDDRKLTLAQIVDNNSGRQFILCQKMSLKPGNANVCNMGVPATIACAMEAGICFLV